MMNQIYICDNKKFIWKALVVSHLIEQEDICEYCNGMGYISTFRCGVGDDNDGKCSRCYGKRRKTWHGPMFFDNEVQPYLQKCLDKYIENKNRFMKENPPFLGMNI